MFRNYNHITVTLQYYIGTQKGKTEAIFKGDFLAIPLSSF